jgi:hypothetical protein
MKNSRIVRTFLLGTTLAIGASVGLAPLAHAGPVKAGDKVVEATPKTTVDPGSPVSSIPEKVKNICKIVPEICKPGNVTPPKSTDPGQPTGTTPPKPTGTTPPKPKPEDPKSTTHSANPDAPVQAKVAFTG